MLTLIEKATAARVLLGSMLLSTAAACAPDIAAPPAAAESAPPWVDDDAGVEATGAVEETADGFSIKLALVADAKATTEFTVGAPKADDEVARITIRKTVEFDGQYAEAVAEFRLVGTSEYDASFEPVGTPDERQMEAVAAILAQSELGDWVDTQLPQVDPDLFFPSEDAAKHCKTTTELLLACGGAVASCIMSAVNWLAVIKCGIGAASCAYTAYHYYKHGKC